jgi:hypothetical protein
MTAGLDTPLPACENRSAPNAARCAATEAFSDVQFERLYWISSYFEDVVVSSGSTRRVKCPCPGHRGVPCVSTLRIRASVRGKLTLNCASGCSTDDVLKAVGLSLEDLEPTCNHTSEGSTSVTGQPKIIRPADGGPQLTGDKPLPLDHTHEEYASPVSVERDTPVRTLDEARDEAEENQTAGAAGDESVPAADADAIDPHDADSTDSPTGDTESALPWLDALAKQWESQHHDDLAIRHRTGALINGEIGAPGRRQPRGKGVIQAVTARLNVSVSEVSRMRAFAAKFPSFDAFREEHPEVHAWSAAKPLLTAPRKSSPKQDDRKRTFNAAIRTVARMRERFADLEGYAPEDEQRQRLQETFTELGRVLPTSLGVCIAVKPVKPAKIPRVRAQTD